MHGNHLCMQIKECSGLVLEKGLERWVIDVGDGVIGASVILEKLGCRAFASNVV